MGGKQSTEATTSARNGGSHSTSTTHSSNTVGSNRRSRVVTSLDSTSRNPTFPFSGENLMRSSHTGAGSRTDHRQHRSHSTADTGMRLSRPGFEWFLASHRAETDSSQENNVASTSRNFTSQSLAHRPANLSRSLPPFFFRPNRGKTNKKLDTVFCFTGQYINYNVRYNMSDLPSCTVLYLRSTRNCFVIVIDSWLSKRASICLSYRTAE